MIMLQSIVVKPQEQLYWSKNPIISTPFFSKLISRRRFLLLKKYLHFANNEEFNPDTHPNPKLNKIWPIFTYLNKKFQEAYTPQRDVTIDESLMLYKGRLGWIQYIPKKRARFGIKSYMLCEAKSGYIWSIIIYTGKHFLTGDEYKDLPMSAQVVMMLMEPLLDKGYCLTTDNFYTSPILADLLISHNTDIYGTMKPTRKGVPKQLQLPKKVKKGYITSYRKGKVMVMRWKDKRDVYFLSTLHNSQTIEIQKRNETIKRPILVHDYNFTMGGVDKVDQHFSSYPIPRKRGKRYYKKIFYHLIEQALWNSYVLYLKTGGTMSSLEYRLKLIETYVENYFSAEMGPKSGRPSTTHNPLRLSERHFIEHIPPTDKKEFPTRRCIVCSSKKDGRGKKVRRESRYYCPDCDVGLCLDPCFRIYHTRKEF